MPASLGLMCCCMAGKGEGEWQGPRDISTWGDTPAAPAGFGHGTLEKHLFLYKVVHPRNERLLLLLNLFLQFILVFGQPWRECLSSQNTSDRVLCRGSLPQCLSSPLFPAQLRAAFSCSVWKLGHLCTSFFHLPLKRPYVLLLNIQRVILVVKTRAS